MKEETNKNERQEERRLLSALQQLEDLATKKTRVYSRLLTQVTLAQEMQSLSCRHQERQQVLQSLLTGEKIQNERGMSKTNQQGERK